MDMLENYMVTAGAREWEEMNAETPYDKAEYPQMEVYAWDRERVHEIVARVCGMEDGSISEEDAVMIFDHLNQKEVIRETEEWFAKSVDPAKYNEWMKWRQEV